MSFRAAPRTFEGRRFRPAEALQVGLVIGVFERAQLTLRGLGGRGVGGGRDSWEKEEEEEEEQREVGEGR